MPQKSYNKERKLFLLAFGKKKLNRDAQKGEEKSYNKESKLFLLVFGKKNLTVMLKKGGTKRKTRTKTANLKEQRINH